MAKSIPWQDLDNILAKIVPRSCQDLAKISMEGQPVHFVFTPCFLNYSYDEITSSQVCILDAKHDAYLISQICLFDTKHDDNLQFIMRLKLFRILESL